MTEVPWITRQTARIGDMHPKKYLQVHQDRDGDIQVSIMIDKIPIGGTSGDYNGNIEFCSMSGGGGRSPAVRAALLKLMEAIEEDNKTRPDADPSHPPG